MPPGVDSAPGALKPMDKAVFTTPSGEAGLLGSYYSNMTFQGEPAFTRTDGSMVFDWNKEPPRQGFPRENFSVKWTGFLTPAESGNYEIGLASDDGSRMILDGKTVIDNWGLHGTIMVKGFMSLEKGHKYPVEIDFYQKDGGANINLSWTKLPSGKLPWVEQAVSLAQKVDKVILVVGSNHDQEGEGGDKNSLEMPDNQDELVSEVLKARPDAVVVLINGTPVAMPWANNAKAILEAWYPGLEGGNALPRVLFGDVNPSGKLPVTFPKRLEDSPAHALGDYPPKNEVLKYDEGVLVGYRWYDTKNIQPLFPFGHGLSYTRFGYGKPSVTVNGEEADVTLSVTNTGKVAGAEVVQVYVGESNAPVLRPSKELKGFAKVWLSPGETKPVTIHLDRRAFAYYSPDKRNWVVDGGAYKLEIGSSSRDIREFAVVKIGGS